MYEFCRASLVDVVKCIVYLFQWIFETTDRRERERESWVFERIAKDRKKGSVRIALQQ